MGAQRFAHQRAARFALRRQAGRGPLGLVGIVVDDRIPQVEGDRADHGGWLLRGSGGQGKRGEARSPPATRRPVSTRVAAVSGGAGMSAWTRIGDDPGVGSVRSGGFGSGFGRRRRAGVPAQAPKNSDMTSIVRSIPAESMSRWVTRRFGFRTLMRTWPRSQCATRSSSRSGATFTKTMLVCTAL